MVREVAAEEHVPVALGTCRWDLGRLKCKNELIMGCKVSSSLESEAENVAVLFSLALSLSRSLELCFSSP